MRLGKQRVECWQIYMSLTEPSYGWKNHPAVKMWKGYEEALLLYGIDICFEWRSRGYDDSMLERFWDKIRIQKWTGFPPWLGNEKFHLSHQSNLIRKLPDHYGPLFLGVPDDISYYWPC